MQSILRCRRLAALSVLIALAAGAHIPRRAAAAPGSEAAALRSRVECVHTEKSISLGLRDADLILRRYPDLKALVTLQDGAGRPVDTYLIDFAHEATPSHGVFPKAPGRDYRAYALRLTHRDGVLLDVSARLPQPTSIQTTGRLKLLDETADLERGTAFDAAAAPQIRLPDFSRTPTYKVPKAPRETSVAACRRRVVSDFNFPIAGQTAFVSDSTPAARDLSDHSIYIPVNNDLYDPETGLYQSTFKYMVEIPIDPAWIADAKDTVTLAPPDRIRLHMTTEEIEVRRLGKQRITGNRKGLLGQTMNSTAMDDEGNLYFAMAYRSPIRFNVKKGRWEAPPVNVYDFHLQFKPKVEDLPYEKGDIEGVRTDFNNVIFYHRGRIYVAPTRYAIFGSLLLASVISIPVDHWDDKAAFEKAMRLNAASFPGAKFALWDTHVAKEDRRRKLNLMLAMGNRICLLAYHRNYFWIMEVADDGSTTKLVPVKTLNGKPIEEFTYEMNWLLRGENVLGLQMKIRLKGEKKMRTAFLPMDGYALTEKLPEKAVKRSFYYNKRTYLYNSARSYGRLTCSKYNITQRMGKPHIGGNLTLYYDVWPRLRAVAEPYRDIVARMTAASMGPEYYLVSLPDRSMEVLGNADYPQYNFARYDCSSKAPAVKRTFLEKDLGDLDVRLGLGALLGPYCHHWFRDDGDDVLYYAGYTGIARLRYRVQGPRSGPASERGRRARRLHQVVPRHAARARRQGVRHRRERGQPRGHGLLRRPHVLPPSPPQPPVQTQRDEPRLQDERPRRSARGRARRAAGGGRPDSRRIQRGRCADAPRGETAQEHPAAHLPLSRCRRGRRPRPLRVHPRPRKGHRRRHPGHLGQPQRALPASAPR